MKERKKERMKERKKHWKTRQIKTNLSFSLCISENFARIK
jgi:hypothetical protein